MIVVPEVIIKDELEVIIRRYYDDYVALELVGTVVDAIDVDSGVTFNITQQGAVGTPEITEITTPDATSLSGTHFFLYTPSTHFFVWYNEVGANSVRPSLTDKKEIKVDIATGDSASDVALKTQQALNLQKLYFSAVVATATVTVTNIETDATNRSLLWSVFEDLRFDNMSYSDQLVAIIKARYESMQRPLVINLGFNKNREAYPQVSILLPSEENDPKQIGAIQGSQSNNDGTYSEYKVHSYSTTYTLFITSDNQNEVILLYHFLKAIILGSMEQFECRGLQNIWISGRDITMDFDVDPIMSYHRSVAISFFYENAVASFNSTTSATDINFTGTLI